MIAWLRDWIEDLKWYCELSKYGHIGFGYLRRFQKKQKESPLVWHEMIELKAKEVKMIKAIGERVIVEAFTEETKDPKSGLIIPNRSEHIKGWVVAVPLEDESALEVGDHVWIPRNGGIEVEVNGDKFLSVHRGQILAAWKDE